MEQVTITLIKETTPNELGGETIWFLLKVNDNTRKAFMEKDEQEAKTAYISYLEFYKKHGQLNPISETVLETTI